MDKIERNLMERLQRSTGGVVHVDPLPDQDPNRPENDGVASFFDNHDVIENYKGDAEKTKTIAKWVSYQIGKQLQEIIQKRSEMRKRLRQRFKEKNHLRSDTDFKRLHVTLVSGEQSRSNPKYYKYWFQIETVPE